MGAAPKPRVNAGGGTEARPLRIEKPSNGKYIGRVSIRPFFAILIAAAMILSPFALRGGMAMAAPAGNHHAEMTNQDHCSPQQGERDAGNADGKNCCAAMCANIVLPTADPVEPLAYAQGIDQPAIASIGTSFLAKLPTPPPRAA